MLLASEPNPLLAREASLGAECRPFRKRAMTLRVE
jgi:hypothetical protein